MINAEHLQKAFTKPGSGLFKREQVKAVQDVSFSAADGSVTGLLGPNGAGKSTTLRMLATLIQADGGSATIDGLDIKNDLLKVRQQLGFMPHNAGIYPRLSARENITYYARLCGLDKAKAQSRVNELAEQLEMTEFLERRAMGFSQGQRTKVALARALVHQPQTIMLDEPTNGLDVMATRGLRTIIRELANQGHCIVFSSHIMQEVAALCDRVAIIANGTIAIEDNLDGIRRRTGFEDLEDAFVEAIGAAPVGAAPVGAAPAGASE